MERLLFIVYIIAFGAIVWYLLYLRRRTVVSHVIVETPVATWWPWSISRYNEWPYWSGWYVGGGNGGYYKPPMHHSPPHDGHPPSHGGGGHHRPWGGAGRTANAGGFHGPSGHTGPSAPTAHSKS